MEQQALQIRRVAIDTWRENVAYLHRDCEVVRAIGFQALAKVQVRANGQAIAAVLNVVDDARIVSACELGLSEDAFARLAVEEGHPAFIAPAEPPESIPALHRKIAGERLGREDLRAIMRDIAAARYSKIELAAFVVATNGYDLDRDEVLHLTEAMIEAGRRLDWHQAVRGGPVVDKHCIGGIPGNRTSMLVVPIVTAHGMLCPKTSSRAITSPAGTADTMEVLAQVELPFERLRQIVRDSNGCLAWGGTADLSPADDILISVERPLAIDSPGQMVASILSKKIAAGSTHLVLDIPIGATAKVRSMPAALRLRKLFEYVADRLHLQLDVMITDGSQPIGRGIGPVLEARDVMQVLRNDPAAPSDLRDKSLRLAGRVIEFDPDVRGGDGWRIARDILESGRALAQMEAIIEAQGRREQPPALGDLTHEVLAAADGVVGAIDNLHLARIARLAGAPQVAGAGVDLLAKLGDAVHAGQPLYRIHARYAADLGFARNAATRDGGYRLEAPGATVAPLP
ncbi:MAG TPA: thymidine phosphorylase family protein [Burkholderiaceae bacterium]|nr:thymidine phosphorylase family protein [Burkholderiaceae bacterium]HMZ00462.1 thymidine phosphorylase family protein [Burkholderiaceae bacterium]HNB45475.1 thymidine phosphorylase family protein [Burkholderiaceae bacterium]HNG78685.1 thymidine phosphorylase family protein [Burkholderiaceae bacterium]